MGNRTFPERIETPRLIFERLDHATVDPSELHEVVSRDGWQERATEHMPWFRFQELDEVRGFIDKAEQEWDDNETARYMLRGKNEDNAIIGLTAYGPEWEKRRAGSGIVLAPDYWGNEYGVERASVFVELTFERYDLDAYYSTCAAGNTASRRMIEKYIEKYGGRHEGLLRQHSIRPDGEVTDQHRFTILRREYQTAIENIDTIEFTAMWEQ